MLGDLSVNYRKIIQGNAMHWCLRRTFNNQEDIPVIKCYISKEKNLVAEKLTE